MNEFLNYLYQNAREEKERLSKLIEIDNQIQFTKFSVEKLYDYLEKNQTNSKLLDININNNTIVITEGNPFIIIALLNDFPNKISDLFLSRSYLGINNWLYNKYQLFYSDYGSDFNLQLDTSDSFAEYIDNILDVLVIGSEEFVYGAKEDFERDILTSIIKGWKGVFYLQKYCIEVAFNI